MSSYENYQSVFDQITSFGLLVNYLEIDRTTTKRCAVDLSKCPVDNDKRKTAGWYKLHSFVVDGKSYIVGTFGYWKGSNNNVVKVEWDKAVSITPEQRAAMADAHKLAIKQSENRRKAEIKRACAQAQGIWSICKDDGISDYLQAKQVGAHGVRFDPHGKGTVLVPVRDAKGVLFGLQFVRAYQRKKDKLPQKQFLPAGMDMKGHFHLIGNPTTHLLIAEGYATAASLHEATGLPVAVAFNANNLTPVAKALKDAYPRCKLIVCADDDYLTAGNPGVTAAQNAALSVGGEWVKPDFVVAGVDIRNGEKLTDFNDLHVHAQGGLRLVASQLARYLSDALPAPKPATSAGDSTTGDGERKRAVSVMSVDEIVERFTYIDDDSGEYCFDNWERRIVRIKKAQSLLPNDVRWDRVKGHPNWQKNAVYKDQIGFDPTGKDENIKRNRWRGWPNIPANHESHVDHCEKLLGLLFELCSVALNKPMRGEKDVYRWVLQWLAYPIQHPGEKLDTALIFHGPQGTGKNLFFNTYGSIYDGESENRKHFSLITQDTMEDQFNSDWVDQKLFVLADEIVAMQERTHVKNKLKTMVTGERIRVNQKMVAAYSDRNHYNMVFLSNETNPVVLERNDRRYFVIWTSGAKTSDYYLAVAEEIKNGGAAALHQYLLNVDLSDFNPNGHPPMTEAKQDLIFLNLDSPQAFYTEWANGYLGLKFAPCPLSILYGFYRKWCYEQGEKFVKTQRQFSSSLGTIGALSKEQNCYKTHNAGEKNSRVFFVIPPFDDFKRAYEAGNDCEHHESGLNGDKTTRKLFTDYYVKFNELAGDLT